jgi:insulysin
MAKQCTILAEDSRFLKSTLDDRKYRAIRLENGLEALLVSDPTTEKSSCALDVNVGFFSVRI